MIIDDINKFIFIHIPKNSGTKMSEILQNLYKNSKILMWVDKKTGIDRMHIHQDAIKQYISSEKIDTYFKFCIVRNPYERIYSAWNSIKNRYPYDNINDFIKFHLTEKFIFGKELVPMDCRVHYRPQYTFIYDDNLNYSVDFVIKYEKLNEDIRQINLLYGFGTSKNIFKKNITLYGENYQNPRYISNFNQESILKINELYDKDFELLQYQKITFD